MILVLVMVKRVAFLLYGLEYEVIVAGTHWAEGRLSHIIPLSSEETSIMSHYLSWPDVF